MHGDSVKRYSMASNSSLRCALYAGWMVVRSTQNDNLHAILQTLYGYWFLQFDFPDKNGLPYRASGGRMVWNSQLKREIPAGWRVASLVSNPLCEPLKPGVAPFSEKTYLATADVVGTTIKDGSRIRYETREGRANMEPVLHSVWFAKMKGSVKHLFLNEACASLISETILSTGFVGLKCEPVAFEYIASFIASEQFEPLKDLHAHGATQQAVNNTDLENILLPIPDAETLRRFSQLASSTLSRFNASIVENKRLQELRDWLLPMLMNGQVTVASSDKLSFAARCSHRRRGNPNREQPPTRILSIGGGRHEATTHRGRSTGHAQRARQRPAQATRIHPASRD